MNLYVEMLSSWDARFFEFSAYYMSDVGTLESIPPPSSIQWVWTADPQLTVLGINAEDEQVGVLNTIALTSGVVVSSISASHIRVYSTYVYGPSSQDNLFAAYVWGGDPPSVMLSSVSSDGIYFPDFVAHSLEGTDTSLTVSASATFGFNEANLDFTEVSIPEGYAIKWDIYPSSGVNAVKFDGTNYTFGQTVYATSAYRLSFSAPGFDTYTILTSSSISATAPSQYWVLGSTVWYRAFCPSALRIYSSMDNEPETRVVTLTAKGYVDGYGAHNIGSECYISWQFLSGDTQSITAYNVSNEIYTWGTVDNAGAINPLTCRIKTDTFTANPKLSTWAIGCSAGGAYSILTPITASIGVSADQFPDASIFDAGFRINYEDTHDVNQMWRISYQSTGEVETSASQTVSGQTGITPFSFDEAVWFPSLVSAVYTTPLTTSLSSVSGYTNLTPFIFDIGFWWGWTGTYPDSTGILWMLYPGVSVYGLSAEAVYPASGVYVVYLSCTDSTEFSSVSVYVNDVSATWIDVEEDDVIVSSSTEDTYTFSTDGVHNISAVFIVDSVPAVTYWFTGSAYTDVGAYSTLSVTAIDTSNYTAAITAGVSGTQVWTVQELSSYSVGTSWTSAVLSGVPEDGDGPGVYVVCMSVSAASAAGWLSPHTKTACLSVLLVPYWLSADYLMYPTYVWTTSALLTEMNTSNFYTYSQGVCAYGEGRTENFYVSVLDPSTADTYQWTIGEDSFTRSSDQSVDNPFVLSIESSAEDFTSSISGLHTHLGMFDKFLLSTMISAHTADNGIATVYPNFKETNAAIDTDLVFQNIRMFPYEMETVGIVVSSYMVQPPLHSSLVVSRSLVWPSASPVGELGSTYVWTLSTAAWTVTASGPSHTFDFVVSGPGIPLSVEPSEYTVMDLSVYMNLGVCIPNSPWETYRVYRPHTLHTTISAIPVFPSIYVPNHYILTGELVAIENLMVSSQYVSGFEWNDGLHGVYKTASYSPYVTSYSVADNYTVTLGVSTIYGPPMITNSFENVLVVQNEYNTFDEDIIRIFGETTVALPHSLQDCQVPPNEKVTADTMNLAFNKLNENLNYLHDAATVYDAPPTEFYGWLGWKYRGIYPRFNWHVNIPGINSDYLEPETALTGLLSAKDMYVGRNNFMYVANTTEVLILSSDYASTPIASRSYKAIGDPFVDLVAIDVDSDGRIYILDNPTKRVLVLEYNFTTHVWRVLYEWGGLGGLLAASKFRNPRDLTVDNNNYVWVADYGNNCVKKYSRTGGWSQTLTTPYFDGDGAPLSMALDEDGNVHVLTKGRVVKMNSAGSVLKTYTWTNPSKTDPRKIDECADGGFLYITFSDKIIKISKEGEQAGIFADDLSVPYDFTGAFHDVHRNFYIADGNVILKYVDKLDIDSLKLTTLAYQWPMSAIWVESEEYQQDWVLNLSFSRFWDNLELFRRSLLGYAGYSELRPGVSSLHILNFNVEDYHEFEVHKDQIYVGINEFNAADVVNRCITYLYECEDYLRYLVDL